MSLETAVAMAHATGRTLVLPPPQRIYLLNKEGSHADNVFDFDDFFHFNSIAREHPGINIISFEEFLNREAMTGMAIIKR